MKRTLTLWSLATLTLFFTVALSSAQDSQQTAPAPDQQPTAQQPSQPSQSPAQDPQTTAPAPSQNDQSATSSPSSGNVQNFAGTVVKTGDKWVLQDASGTSYDVDRQDLLKQYEGKKVTMKGTLDADGKTIHVK
jgi:hypothetical protein